MIIDSRLEFSDAQALTATADSTSSIDLSSDRDIGVGETVYWVVQVDVAADGTTGDETYVAALETDDNSSFSSGTNIATITIPRSTVAGTRYFVSVPNANERYLQVQYTLAGTTPTVTVSSWLQFSEPTAWQAYPDATN